MAIGAAVMVGQTDRGDEMFLTMARRHAAHALDLEVEAVLPAALVRAAGAGPSGWAGGSRAASWMARAHGSSAALDRLERGVPAERRQGSSGQLVGAGLDGGVEVAPGRR